jgi:hypothetical protein
VVLLLIQHFWIYKVERERKRNPDAEVPSLLKNESD